MSIREDPAGGGEGVDVGRGDFSTVGVEGVDIAVAQVVAEDVEDIGHLGGAGEGGKEEDGKEGGETHGQRNLLVSYAREAERETQDYDYD